MPAPADPPDRIKSPICCVDGPHCGAWAVVESTRTTAASTTLEVRCLTCGATGAISSRVLCPTPRRRRQTEASR